MILLFSVVKVTGVVLLLGLGSYLCYKLYKVWLYQRFQGAASGRGGGNPPSPPSSFADGTPAFSYHHMSESSAKINDLLNVKVKFTFSSICKYKWLLFCSVCIKYCKLVIIKCLTKLGMAHLRIRFWGLSWSCATPKDCRRYTHPGVMQSVYVLMTIILQFLVNPQTLR